MTATPQVSVLIRTRDRKDLLQEAVGAVLSQTWPAIEIIIVNDGGEDFGSEIASGDNNIRWINNSPPHGRSHAANLLLESAGGQYCLFLDDDDLIDPDHISNLMQALQDNPDYPLAYSAVRVQENGVEEDTPSFAFPFDATRLMVENFIPIHAVLFSRELLAGGYRFDPDFDRFEDWDFWLQIAQQHDFYYVDKCTAVYRVNSGSGFGAKENTADEMDNFRLALYRKWLARWTDDRLLELINRSREFPRIALLRNENASKSEFIDMLKSRVDDRDTKIHALYKNLSEMEWDFRETENQLRSQQSVNQAVSEELELMYNSRSWKLTRPLRLMTRVRYFLHKEGFRGLLARIKTKLEARTDRVVAIRAESPVTENFGPLDFPQAKTPLTSIIIPVYNKTPYTFHCLQSILAHHDDESFEVIVVDDCSTDQTPAMLADISGIRVIRNEQNLGFIHSCNAGATAARGKYLVILNNDTEVRKGWIRAMRQTFSDFPDAGLVGARLVFADGTLQEAGGIVWRDGSAWNYGRDDDPNKPEYAYCREVDYCSGACLMISREDFNGFGGFDTHYVPAYYEDTDLAFKVRNAGKKVYYQPGATLIHFEGITSGTDVGSSIKQYQQVNLDKFFARWEDALEQHRPNGRLPQMEKERHIQKRILVVDARILMPDHDSGSLRMFNILQVLQRIGYKVIFMPANLHHHERYTPQMQALGFECLYQPYVQNVGNYIESFGYQFDAVILSRADYAEKYIDVVKRHCTNAVILFDTVDLHFLREQREAELSGDALLLESARMRKSQELSIARKADITLVVSEVELGLFQQEAPGIRVGLLTNIHQNHETLNVFNDRSDILFIGNFEHPPNIDAMEWFLDEVFPLVLKENSQIRLHIVGGHLPSRLKARAGDNVLVPGFVTDIQPLFENIRLSIAPLRYGAGVKGKINSSMSYGVPVVATSMAAEGMNLEHGKDAMIADAPEEFAGAILRLYEDEALWESLSAAGKRNIEEHFSFTVAERQLRSVLSD